MKQLTCHQLSKIGVQAEERPDIWMSFNAIAWLTLAQNGYQLSHSCRDLLDNTQKQHNFLSYMYPPDNSSTPCDRLCTIQTKLWQDVQSGVLHAEQDFLQRLQDDFLSCHGVSSATTVVHTPFCPENWPDIQQLQRMMRGTEQNGCYISLLRGAEKVHTLALFHDKDKWALFEPGLGVELRFDTIDDLLKFTNNYCHGLYQSYATIICRYLSS
ncbi:MAG: hypothetical protein ACRC5A_08625 [Enterobacteriaceae bacterium]